jgi:undecaprenyl-diphosphatase
MSSPAFVVGKLTRIPQLSRTTDGTTVIAQAAMVGYAVLLLVFLPVLRGPVRLVAVIVAVLLVAAIGFSRVALGVHFVSDVLAGYVLGAAWVASMIALFNLWRRESGRPAVDPVRGLEPENAGRLDPRSSGSEAA